jgi:hypothetical protein
VYATLNKILRRVNSILSSSKTLKQKIQKPIFINSGYTANHLAKPTSDSLKTKLKVASKFRLYNASGNNMKVSGQCEVWVDIPTLNRQKVLSFLVTPDLPPEEQVLLGTTAL